MLKALTIKITEEEHRNIKMLSAGEGKSIKNFIMDLVRTYSQKKEYIEIDSLSYDELSDEEKYIIDKGREEISRGEYIDIDDFLEEIENEDKNK